MNETLDVQVESTKNGLELNKDIIEGLNEGILEGDTSSLEQFIEIGERDYGGFQKKIGKK